MKLPLPADVVRLQIEEAKVRHFESIKTMAHETIRRLDAHIGTIIRNPELYFNLESYSEEVNISGLEELDLFLNELNAKLSGLGYKITYSNPFKRVYISWKKD